MIINKSDGTLTIMTETHDSLKASATDNLSDEELNVKDEVNLTVLTVSTIIRSFFYTLNLSLHQRFITYMYCVLKVNDTKKAVRLKKLPEGSVTFNQKAKGNENISGTKDNTSGSASVKDKVVYTRALFILSCPVGDN